MLHQDFPFRMQSYNMIRAKGIVLASALWQHFNANIIRREYRRFHCIGIDIFLLLLIIIE